MYSRLIGIITSFVLVSFSQPDHKFLAFLTSFLGFALFFYSLKGELSHRKKFLIGTSWFLGVQLIQLFWMATPYYHGFEIYYPYVFLSLAMGLQWGLLTLFFKDSLSYQRILAMASFWTLMEYSRLYFLCGFPFNPIGQSLAYSLPSLQWASVLGILGLTFWILLTNLVLIKWWEEKSMRTGSVALAIAALPALFGYWNLHLQKRALENGDHLKVALVQTGLYAEEKTAFQEKSDEYLPPLYQWERIILGLRDQKGKEIDLIVLPESALPFDIFHPHLSSHDVKEMFMRLLNWDFVPKTSDHFLTNGDVAQGIANYFSSELIMGATYYNATKKESYNSAVHFSPNKTLCQMYHKRVLVPLSEYLPVSFIRSFLAQHGIEYFFTPGNEANVFYGKTVVSPSICYEECFSHLVREGKVRGAKLLANLSNDVWFPHSRLPKDHFHLGRFRAVENGLPLVRACNTGITAGVDCFGHIVGRLEEKADRDHWFQGVLFLEIPTYTASTFYSLTGNCPTLAFSIFMLSTFFIFRKKYRL